MPRSPAPLSSRPGESDRTTLEDPAARSIPRFNHPQPETLLEALREQIACGEQERDVLLDAITVAAQFVTDASGAALAMRRDGVVTCVGRSGDIAPERGSRVSEESGFSGECLREGRTLRCDDTESDARVEAEVCRALGIRSIAAVPVRSSEATVGVLETFSSVAHAFSDEHLAFLSSLAGLVEMACAAEPAFKAEAAASTLDETPIVAEPRLTSAFWAKPEWWQQKKFRYAAIAGAVAVLLLSIGGWRWWSAPSREVKAQTQTQAVPALQDRATVIDVLGSAPVPSGKPDAGRSASRESSGVKPPLVQASSKELDEVPVVRRFDAEAQTPVANVKVERFPAETTSEPEPEPQIAGVGHSGEALSGLVATTAAIPSLGVPISQGVTAPVVERRVMPRYPAQALAVRMEGVVVLQAWVNESGRVDQVDLVSGPQALGQAAMEAVREWKYRPAMLNGKPVRTETRITINFQASTAR